MISTMKHALLCRLCGRELTAYQDRAKEKGTLPLSLRCPKHGTLKRGERFMTGFTSGNEGAKRWPSVGGLKSTH